MQAQIKGSKRDSPNAGLMLAHRRRRWANIRPALVKHFVSVGTCHSFVLAVTSPYSINLPTLCCMNGGTMCMSLAHHWVVHEGTTVINCLRFSAHFITASRNDRNARTSAVLWICTPDEKAFLQKH